MLQILLLEPNTLLATTYTQALAHNGHKTVHAPTAQAALFAADKQRPDVIILELQLPNHNGIEFLHEFRSYPEWQGVPVIVHTSLTPPITAAASDVLRRELGVRHILYKPHTSLTALLRAVGEAAEV